MDVNRFDDNPNLIWCFHCENCKKYCISPPALKPLVGEKLLCYDCSFLKESLSKFINNYHEEYEAQVGMD